MSQSGNSNLTISRLDTSTNRAMQSFMPYPTTTVDGSSSFSMIVLM
eukprot:CAMPEP_0183768924 /NCGR_PEP_ID=MMETSP0739-20130205/19495_1 /TAXON_ID=385413 /ORGANISM="Thalassiosira miniscula, Strain CCMP1093" /LENGTH=45 /DNA_ID= /DNA_START= /DNA_END= /DNA_ORIENTATION=